MTTDRPVRSRRARRPGRRAAVNPSPRTGRATVAAVAVPLGLVVSGLLVWESSYAAFFDQTENPGNAWTTGEVVLTDDDADAAAFTVADMVPGKRGAGCVTVTYGGTVASQGVRVFGEVTGDPALAGELDFAVEQGTASATCAAFTAAGPAVYSGKLRGIGTGWTSGHGTWVPLAAGDKRSYRFTYALPKNRYDATIQGKTTTLKVVWEAQSVEEP
ncbi:hypothetical protein [Quadrisphaera sp. DSM 44207]|uniref:hypothetical protein n=1 Tax=Quadrisphaera sp. DSM 44207 TaxID=1881057 RepID=UPI0008904F32|nr:hypothetical protein [Quadrisphaera sp. DSM 44207]SDQ11722.1 hypothetical protein SAMN05428996_0621 [Quadrisphaera sp. DSM 44207]